MISPLSVGMLVSGAAKNIKQSGAIAPIRCFPVPAFFGTAPSIEAMLETMREIVGFFPSTQGITMMKNAFSGVSAGSVLPPVCVMLGLTVRCAGLAIRFFHWE